jgi:condensin complex subunit 1
MCVSADFCEANLPLLFTILENTNNPVIRSNIVIGLGDLTICFNSIIDPHISHLYNRLKDEDFQVKKNAMMILTFLILNGMIKVKGQISEMAKCTEDDDEKIKELSRAFFKELSTKDNAIYNNLPDILSNLSTIDEDKYKKIVKFLFEFITKDKYLDSLVEKLCHRFHHASSERQWRDIGYCLSKLNFTTEKSVRKLIDFVPLFKDKLYENTLYKYFEDMIQKGQKQKTKQDLKTVLDEFKDVLEKERKISLENWKAQNDAQNKQTPLKVVLPDYKRSITESFEVDEEDDGSMNNDNKSERKDLNGDETLSESEVHEEVPVVAVRVKKGKQPVKRARKKVVISESDSDESIAVSE